MQENRPNLPGLSRREFLRRVGLAALGLGLGVTGVSLVNHQDSAVEKPKNRTTETIKTTETTSESIMYLKLRKIGFNRFGMVSRDDYPQEVIKKNEVITTGQLVGGESYLVQELQINEDPSQPSKITELELSLENNSAVIIRPFRDDTNKQGDRRQVPLNLEINLERTLTPYDIQALTESGEMPLKFMILDSEAYQRYISMALKNQLPEQENPADLSHYEPVNVIHADPQDPETRINGLIVSVQYPLDTSGNQRPQQDTLIYLK